MTSNVVSPPIHELLDQRWSPRAFDSRPVGHEQLRSIFEAARWAASAFNAQPWAFLVATQEEPAEFERLWKCLLSFNQVWARRAPVLLLAVARTQDDTGQVNRYAWHDVGLAVANLTFQATALGLAVRQMAGFDAELARQRYAIPRDWEPVSVIALGYQGAAEQLPEKLQTAEVAARTRKPLREMVYSQIWGKGLLEISD